MSIDIWLGLIAICLIYLFFIKEVSLQSSIKHAKTFYEKLSKSLTFTIKHAKIFYEKLSESLTLTGFSNKYGDIEYGKISIFTIIITIVIFLVGFELLTGNYSSGLTKTGLIVMDLSGGILIFHIIYEISKKIFRMTDDADKFCLGAIVFLVVICILLILRTLYQHEIRNCFY